MITEAGTKRPRLEPELVKATGLPLGTVRYALLTLADAGLVRPLGTEPPLWEIAHDFIALQLGLIQGRLRPPVWRQSLATRCRCLGGSGWPPPRPRSGSGRSGSMRKR